MEPIKSKIDGKRLAKLILMITSVVVVVVAVVAGIIILADSYNSRLHENFNKAAKVYGQNGFTQEIYEFEVESIEEIKSQMNGLRRIETTEPNTYQTYIVVEMGDTDRYLIKYSSEKTVQIIKAETDESGAVQYGEANEFSAEGTLPQLCKALEIDHGMGFIFE